MAILKSLDTSPNWLSLEGPIGTFASRLIRNPAAREDITRWTESPTRRTLGIIGSFAGAPELGISEVRAAELPQTPTQPQQTPAPTGQVAGVSTGAGAPPPSPTPQQLGGGEAGPSMRDINPKRSLLPLQLVFELSHLVPNLC